MKLRAPILIGGTIAIVAIAILLPDANEPGRPASEAELNESSDSPGGVSASQSGAGLDATPTEAVETPDAPADSQSAPAAPPNEDLVLTGLSGFGDRPSALFAIMLPEKPDLHFMLHEGDENEWLKVLSVDAPHGRVKAILKRPVMRVRKTGVEVILSFNVHGRQRL